MVELVDQSEAMNARGGARPARASVIVPALGVTQIFAWGGSFFLLTVLAGPIAADTGWSLKAVFGGFSLCILVAGLASPSVGRAIADYGGRPVLALSAVALALGLIALAVARNLPAYYCAWFLLGFGMAAGLYDPAFATLGRIYGQKGRSAISTLTLFGGFASTICWPLTAYVQENWGWRTTCLVYAAIELGLALPIYLFLLPREPRRAAAGSTPAAVDIQTAGPAVGPRARVFWMLASSLALTSFVSTVISVHLIRILQLEGATLKSAVALAAFVGPAQVGARAIEVVASRWHQPIWTKVAASALFALGLGALAYGGEISFLALVLYGGGVGLESIARGTLPLTIYGTLRFPEMVGRIAAPSLIALAAAPAFGAVLLDAFEPHVAVASLAVVAALNLLIVAALFLETRAKS